MALALLMILAGVGGAIGNHDYFRNPYVGFISVVLILAGIFALFRLRKTGRLVSSEG